MKEGKKKRKRSRSCSRCEKLEEELRDTKEKLRDTERELRKTKRQLKKALRTIDELNARLGQNSQNSSRPPSTDPPDAPPRREKPRSKRKRGGQIGHKGKRRKLLPVEEVDRIVVHKPDSCEHCHEKLPDEPGPNDPPPARHQVVELRENPCEVTEHQAEGRVCLKCGKVTRAVIPEDVAGSSFGPRLASLIVFLTGVLNTSRRNAEEFVEDALGVPVALGSVSNLEAEMTEALDQPYQEVAEAVRDAPQKNVDETGWKCNGDRCWLWTAATSTAAFFLIHASRGAKALRDLMADTIKGTFTSDRWGAYGKVLKVLLRQLCWSHLIRDFRKLVDRGGKDAEIGEKALEVTNQVFWLWKDFKAGVIPRQVLQECLRPLKKEMRELLELGAKVLRGKGATFCTNLLALEPALWTFAYREGVEPTNNLAERILRRGVLWRKRAFGCNSERGCRFAERILTVVQTLRLQKRPVLDYLVDALRAHRVGESAPALIGEAKVERLTASA